MGELDKQMQEIVELLNSATPEQRNAVETLLRSRAKPDQIRVLPQDSKDFFICHYAKTLLFVVPIILCYNSYEPTSREKRKIK